jgi:hypothetical protein
MGVWLWAVVTRARDHVRMRCREGTGEPRHQLPHPCLNFAKYSKNSLILGNY